MVSSRAAWLKDIKVMNHNPSLPCWLIVGSSVLMYFILLLFLPYLLPYCSGWGLTPATNFEIASVLRMHSLIGPFSEQTLNRCWLLEDPHRSTNYISTLFSTFTWKMCLLQEHLESVQKEFLIFNREK